jgi:hypothetical protein
MRGLLSCGTTLCNPDNNLDHNAETKFRKSRGNVPSPQLPARKEKVVTVHRQGLEEGGHVANHDLQRTWQGRWNTAIARRQSSRRGGGYKDLKPWNVKTVHMVVGNAFSNCNGSSAFSARVAVGSIKVAIWNKDPLTRFQMCLWKQGYSYL